jgi:thiol-disulfide isomerase/thioredoxin
MHLTFLNRVGRQAGILGVMFNLAVPAQRLFAPAKSLFLVALIGLCCAVLPVAAKTPGEVEVGSTLRDVPMQGLKNPSRMLSDYRGKPLIINVWASWCGPCRQEMGSLQRLSQRHGGNQLNVIGVSTDDYMDRALSFLRLTGTTFDNYIDSRLMLEHMLGAERLPLTLLVDANGKVLAKFTGAKDWDSPAAMSLIGKHFGVKLQAQP